MIRRFSKRFIDVVTWTKYRTPRYFYTATFCSVEKESTSSSFVEKSTNIKRPCDSWISVLFPFKTDIDLRTQYTNMFGNVLIGKLFENFDALAASIAYKHAGA
jgi:hypothetical protein